MQAISSLQALLPDPCRSVTGLLSCVVVPEHLCVNQDISDEDVDYRKKNLGSFLN